MRSGVTPAASVSVGPSTGIDWARKALATCMPSVTLSASSHMGARLIGSGHPLEAVDDEFLAGDEERIRRGEEGDDLCHVLRPARASERDAPRELALPRVDHGGGELGLDDAGADGVDRDGGAQLLRQRA